MESKVPNVEFDKDKIDVESRTIYLQICAILS